MAGIGFELKRIYKENSVTRTFIGSLYSSVVAVGPTLIVMGTIICFYILLGYMNLPYAERELLSSTFLYCFIFPSITTAMTSSVFSRYIADKFYFEKYEDVMPSYYTGLMLNLIIGSAVSIPFVYRLIAIGNVNVAFALVSYALFISVVIVYFSMTYLHATKDYKIIAIDFLIGMAIGFACAAIFRYVLHFSIIDSILYGFTIGFFIIAFLLFAYIRKYFQVSSKNFKESLKYMAKFAQLAVANLLYFAGLFVHNFVFWTTPMQLVVANSYYSMQPYDMATCLALFTNISTIVIFIVMAETRFHDKYQDYIESVIGATHHDIQRNKESMFRTLIQQITRVFAIQIIITAILYLVVIIFFPQLGFSGMTMEIYPAMTIAFLCIFMMYCNLVVLYYLNDQRGAMYTSILFFLITFAAAWFATTLRVEWFGIGPIIGAGIGWTFSFFRIRYIERNFDKHIFCNVKLVEEKKEDVKPNIIYNRRTKK